MAVVRLPVIQTDELTDRDDRFRCIPYRCTLKAGTCIDRQRDARAPRREKNSRGGPRAWAHGGNGERPDTSFVACRDCELGQGVAAQLGEQLPEKQPLYYRHTLGAA